MIMKEKQIDAAVSPVIAVLLMLVVTIIIAAVVSGFAGSLVSGQEKAPQAKITGTFSQSEGFTIEHLGGDSLPTRDITITIKDSRLFGPDVEQRTAQTLNKTIIADNNGKTWLDRNGTVNVTSFNSGEKAYVNTENCNCAILQPVVNPNKGTWSSDGRTFTPGTPDKTALANLCFQNKVNVGKSFIMEVSDAITGKLISKSDVQITS